MKFERVWAMPNKNTFSMAPIKKLIERHIGTGEWVDPFARASIFNDRCRFTNDLDVNQPTTHHMEALDFLRSLAKDGHAFDGVLFDPPYSPRQIAESYRQVGRAVHMEDTQSSFYGDRKRAVADVVKLGGVVICCGWASGGIGKSHGFELQEVLLVPHGGAHNDTIVTVERRISRPSQRVLV